MDPKPSSTLTRAHVSFKGSILERKTRLIIYVSVKLSIRMDHKVKMQKLSPLNPLLKGIPWGCNAFAELRSFTDASPSLGGITALGSLVAALCVLSRMKGSQQRILEASRGFFPPLPAPLSTSSPWILPPKPAWGVPGRKAGEIQALCA